LCQTEKVKTEIEQKLIYKPFGFIVLKSKNSEPIVNNQTIPNRINLTEIKSDYKRLPMV